MKRLKKNALYVKKTSSREMMFALYHVSTYSTLIVLKNVLKGLNYVQYVDNQLFEIF